MIDITNLSTQATMLIAATLATLGWIYTARRSRALSRKQHTVNVLIQAAFNPEYRKNLAILADALKGGGLPDLREDGNDDLRRAFQMVANHFEFIAAGLRNGDFDERLVRDTTRGQILNLYEKCEKFIYKLRDSRRRATIYEHLEWLHGRWEKNPPGTLQTLAEVIIGRPFPGKRVDPHKNH